MKFPRGPGRLVGVGFSVTSKVPNLLGKPEEGRGWGLVMGRGCQLCTDPTPRVQVWLLRKVHWWVF